MSMNNNKSHHIGKPRSNFIRAVGVLVSGTALAHGITALALPVLSRLYSPADFNMLAVLTSLMSIISVAACLRFDVAVAIPDKDIDAANLLALALGCAFLIALLVAIPVLLIPEQIADWLNQVKLASYLWLLPLGVLLASSYSALQTWLVRKREFGQIARSRIAQSAAASAAQLTMGSFGIGTFGLLLGYVFNAGAAFIVLGYRIIRFDQKTLRAVTWIGMRTMATEYHRYPKYSTWEALSNSAAIQVPIILIAALAVGPEAGYLSMAMYVMQAPMALIGGAIGQVYLSRAPVEHREGTLAEFTSEVFGGLLKAGVGPLLFVGIVSPIIFPFVFGEEWRRAGHLVAWMTPWFIMQFLVSPISMALHVIEQQKTALRIQYFGFIVRVLSVLGAAIWYENGITEVYALSGFAFYFIYLIIVLKSVGLKKIEVKYKIYKNILIIVLWALLGLIIFFTPWLFKFLKHN